MKSLLPLILKISSLFGNKMHVVRQQKVVLQDTFNDNDRILDLGGGGEGIIGRLRGKQVTALDKRQEELDEAPEGPIKVVGDACATPFDDASFDAVTMFYFLMYVPSADFEKIFREAFRVLRKNGSVRIWDTEIPQRGTRTKNLFVVPVKAVIHNQPIHTAYGVQWKTRELNCEMLKEIATKVGFVISEEHKTGNAFFITLLRQ